MVRERRRLLIPPDRLVQPVIPLTREESHYLQRVLRLRPGDLFAVVDGVGQLWSAAVEPGAARLLTPLDQPQLRQPAPSPRVQLAVAMPRRDSDVLLRMVTELGVDCVQPLLTERSVAERWTPQRAALIVREAVEQCERLWAPSLGEPAPAAVWLTQVEGLRLLATTREESPPLLLEELSTHAAAAKSDGVTVAIGPEGGWTPAEQQLAIAAGWQPISLGPTILRTSTAAVAAVAALCSWRA